MAFQLDVGLMDLVVVATLLFVLWELRIMMRSMKSDTLQRIYGHHLSLHQVDLDHPKLQRLTTASANLAVLEEMSDDALRGRAYIEWSLDLAEMLWFLQRDGTYPLGDQYLPRLASNPNVRDYWHTSRGTFNPAFEQAFDALVGPKPAQAVPE